MKGQGRPPGAPPRIDADREPAPRAGSGRERTHRLVLRLLFAVARSDATVSTEERTLLERYQRALGLRAEAEPLKIGAAPEQLDLGSIDMTDRVHVLRMMLRMAYADGSCKDVELRLLERLAGMMGLSPLKFTDIRVSVEQEVQHRRRAKLAFLVVAVVLVAIGVGLGSYWLLPRGADPAEVQAFLTQTTQAIDGLRNEIERLGNMRHSDRDAGRIDDFSKRLDQIATDLHAWHEKPRQSSDPSVERALAAFRGELEEFVAADHVFQRHIERYAGSVVLIVTMFDLVSGSESRDFKYDGTGFFVTEDGLIATNKHVVEPWKFAGEHRKLIESGYRLDESTIAIAAWPGGSRFRTEEGTYDVSQAFQSERGQLQIAARFPDRFENPSRSAESGSEYRASVHKEGDSDLVLLRAKVKEPVSALPLEPDPEAGQPLDPVMVLAFAGGEWAIERTAQTMPSRGYIRKIDENLWVDASISGGASGGPVINEAGRVIGMATRRVHDEEALGVCIRSDRLLDLLEQASR